MFCICSRERRKPNTPKNFRSRTLSGTAWLHKRKYGDATSVIKYLVAKMDWIDTINTTQETTRISVTCVEKVTITVTIFKMHMRGHEGKGYPCEYCGKVFKSIKAKQYHESEHSGIYRFTCSKCNKGFNHKNKYEQHLLDHWVQTSWLFNVTFS